MNTPRLFLLITLCLLTLPTLAAPHYAITDLGQLPVPPIPKKTDPPNHPGDTRLLVYPEYLSTTAAAINNQGQVIGQSNGQAFLWQNGTMQGLGVLPSIGIGDLNISKADAINSKRDVVGGSGEFGPIVMSGLYDCRAFLWAAGKLQPLPPDERGGSYEAFGINSKDEVVGLNGYRAFYLHNAIPVDLGTLSTVLDGAEPARNQSKANGINERGQVVGVSTVNRRRFKDNSLPAHAVLWQQTGIHWHITDLGTLPGFVNSEANAINNEREIVGTVSTYTSFYPDDRNSKAFLWSKGHICPLRGRKSSSAQAINDHRQVVGTAGGKAALWQDGQVYDLNTLVPARKRERLTEATGINNHGWIVCNGTHNGKVRAFLLTPQ